MWFRASVCWRGEAEQKADIKVIVKIESADSIPNLYSILDASDGVSDGMAFGPPFRSFARGHTCSGLELEGTARRFLPLTFRHGG